MTMLVKASYQLFVIHSHPQNVRGQQHLDYQCHLNIEREREYTVSIASEYTSHSDSEKDQCLPLDMFAHHLTDRLDISPIFTNCNVRYNS